MTRAAKTLSLGALAFLIVAYPAPVRAQTASEHFPVGAPAAGTTTMKLSVKAKRAPQVQTSDFTLTAGASGAAVAVAAINQICQAAIANGLSCDGTIPAACSGLACCAATTVGTQSYDCDDVPGATAGHGFTVTRINTQFVFSIAPTAGFPVEDFKIQSLNCATTAVHGSDLLDRVLVRLDPNGVNGIATFSVHHSQGGTNPRTFNVDTTGLSDTAIHDLIASGFNSMGLGLTASRSDGSVSFSPEAFSGALVEVNYSSATKATLTDFEVNGAQSGSLRQKATLETAGPLEAGTIPTLSEWAIVILVSALLLTGLWMTRGRRRQPA